MALKLAKPAGDKKKVAQPPDTDPGNPTTQVKMGSPAAARYDPLASVSIMDQLKTASPAAAKSKGLPVIGHLPAVKQFQILAALLVAFLAVTLRDRRIRLPMISIATAVLGSLVQIVYYPHYAAPVAAAPAPEQQAAS